MKVELRELLGIYIARTSPLYSLQSASLKHEFKHWFTEVIGKNHSTRKRVALQLLVCSLGSQPPPPLLQGGR